jgi:hypothetical protein
MRPHIRLLNDSPRRRGLGGRRFSGAKSRPRGSEAPVREAPSRAAPALGHDVLEPDPAVRRTREAGGPEDQAHYSCTCGYVFEADVSTSVACPHCGCQQAW